MRTPLAALAAAPALLAATVPVAFATTITLVSVDPPGVGFNDPTPAAPLGGNLGTTVGEQRFIAVQHAADIWGAILPSPIEIRVDASWEALDCNSTSGFLGFAGPIAIESDFEGATQEHTWYPVALANKLARVDLVPGQSDIYILLNSEVGTSGCLTAFTWYYGLDNHAGGTQFDLVTTTLHELAHGLGSLEFVDDGSGELLGGQIDVYSRFLFDNLSGKRWDQMTNEERAASAIHTGGLVWIGTAVNDSVTAVLGPRPIANVDSPPAIAGSYPVGTADFGPPLGEPGVSGDVVLVNDGSGGTTACNGIANAAAFAGKIALIDRGGCTFLFKVQAAQAAGAIGVVIANHTPGAGVGNMSGSDASITIPSVMVSFETGSAIKGQLANNVHMTLHVDAAHRAGADDANRILLFAPPVVQSGSSVSHWDLSASPDLLMEPNIPFGIPQSGDLTVQLFHDIGWFLDTDPVLLENLSALATAGGVQLRWELGAHAWQSLEGIAVQSAPAAPGPYLDRTPALLEPEREMSWLDAEASLRDSPWYRLVFVAADGTREVSRPIHVEVETGTLRTALLTPYESASGEVDLRYTLASDAPVELQIFTVAGRLVRSFEAGRRERGAHRSNWDRLDSSGHRVGQGVYLVRLRAGTASAAKKLVLLR